MASKTKGRVKIPRNAADLLILANRIYTKHLADGANSPLVNLQDSDWAVSGPKLTAIQALHNDAEMFKRNMEKAYTERDVALQEIELVVRNSAAMLKAINSKNPKRLGDWGFDVDDSAPAPDPATPPPA